jgi:hypothetical protein
MDAAHSGPKMSLSPAAAPAVESKGRRWRRRRDQPDDVKKTLRVEGDEDDVEGHGMLPIDPSSARHLAGAREADIRRHLQRHDLEVEARRPHKKER